MAVFVTSCNIQRFDILQFFEKEKQVFWKQISRCSVEIPFTFMWEDHTAN